MSPPAWIPLLVALGCAAPRGEVPAAPADVWLDVAPDRLVAVAVGDLHRDWMGPELAALDDGGHLHVVVQTDDGRRALACELPVSRPARLVIADVDGSFDQGEVYAFGSDGDLWQAVPLTESGELQVARVAGDFPSRARVLVSGEFRHGTPRSELLVLDDQGGLELIELGPRGEVRRRTPEPELPSCTDVQLVDRRIERAIVLGVGRSDGLLLVDEEGGLWGFTELEPGTEHARFAAGTGRLLGRGRASPPDILDAHLFDQTPGGELRSLIWRGEPRTARWERVVAGLPPIAGLVSSARRSAEGGEVLWTLDELGVLRRSTRRDAAGDGWASEVVHDAGVRGLDLLLWDAEGKVQDTTARLIAAWGSRLVDLGAP